MKRLIYIIFVLFSAFALILASEGIIKSFTSESGGDYVNVKWTTENEANIKQFELERSTEQLNYKKIHLKTANGKPSNYSYVDEEAFMKKDADNDVLSKNTYSYRIKIIYKNNTYSYSDETFVAHKPSSIRRTWGMIKEMFR